MDKKEEHLRQLLIKSKNHKNRTMNSVQMKNEKVPQNEEDFEGDLRLHDAVCDSDEIEEIETLVSEEPKLVFERDKELRTPLHTVIGTGDEKAMEIAIILLGVTESEDESSLISIERPELLNLQDFENSTALHAAARGRQLELTAALLRWGADPNIQNIYGNCLHLAAEGNTDNAVEIARILLAKDINKTLINCVNNQEYTPIHVAIKRQAVKMVDFLLLPKYNCNLSWKNSQGRSILHFACSENGESEKTCKIVKALLQRCKKAELNLMDSNGHTVLHLAAMSRFPKIVKILIEDERMDVIQRDKNGKTALHHAAENGCYTKGYQCVEELIKGKFSKQANQVKYLYKIEDNFKNTAFMLACLNCPATTMKKYTDQCSEPKNWLSHLYMSLVYKNSPLALKPLMDKAFTEVENDMDAEEDGIRTDFGIITGYEDPVMCQQETKYLKESQWWDFETQHELLLHPLVQYFVIKKWKRLWSIILILILIQLFWIAAYTALGISFYTGNTNETIALVSTLFMLIYLLCSSLVEGFEMMTTKSAYILSTTNILQLIQCAFGFIAIIPVILTWEAPETWMKYTTATGVLLAYILSMRDIGKLHITIGLIIEGLKQVLIQIVIVLVCCSPLWMGFTVAFMITFSDQDTLNSSFPGPIVKVLVMMTGEFEYNDTFKVAEGESNTVSPFGRFYRLALFFAFLISVPVGFFNLLTGFALDKVMELREKAKVERISKQLEHIFFIESILLRLRCRWLWKIFPKDWLRKKNVTSKLFNEETGSKLKFETFITEIIRKPERNRRRGRGFWTKVRNIVTFWRTELPKEVFEKIYDLASPKSQE